MSSSTSVLLSNNIEFKARIKAILPSLCSDIIGEDPATNGSETRQRYANQVINQLDSYVDTFARTISTLTSIVDNIEVSGYGLNYTGSATPVSPFDAMDVEIKNGMSSVFNDLAGVFSI